MATGIIRRFFATLATTLEQACDRMRGAPFPQFEDANLKTTIQNLKSTFRREKRAVKLTILAPTGGHHIDQGQAIDIAVRATHDDGAAASNIALTWRPIARQGKWAQRTTKTDDTGTAHNRLTLSGDAQPGSYRMEVNTPGNETHVIGTIDWADEKNGTGRLIAGDAPVMREVGLESNPQIVVTTRSLAQVNPPPLYQNNLELIATYSGPAGQEPPNVMFFVDAGADTDHLFTTLHLASMDSNTATRLLTGYGRNEDVTVKVYARPVEDLGVPPPTGFTLVPAEATFKAVSGQLPQGKILAIHSPDGNPLSVNRQHLLTATFTNLDGTPVTSGTGRDEWSGNIVWSTGDEPTDATKSLTWLTTTPADANGVATNSVKCSGPFVFGITATAYTNGGAVSSSQTFIFQQDVDMDGQGTITVQCDDQMLLNTPTPVQATYLDSRSNPVPDNTWVTWTSFPANRVSFLDGEKTQTINGVAKNHIQASGTTEIPAAYISATSPNDLTGANDFGLSVPIDFTAKPKTNLIGVLIDKAYAQNPTQYLDPTEPNQIIKCQVQVLNQQGAQQVTLLTTPSNALETIFDTSGKELTKDSNDNYVVTTNTSGVGTFLVGSENFTMFDLNAQWNHQTLAVPTKLVLATNMQQRSAVMTAPSVPGVTNGGTLQIPAARPAPTFKVTVPSRYITTGTQVAVLLNNRLVYNGVADPALNTGVDVAYAALNLTGNNNLVYVTPTFQESKQFTFLASGTPQTGPDTGGAQRTLNPPQVGIKSGQTIGPKDIINGGLPVVLDAYDSVALNDTVTMFFYLSGTDVLTAKPVTNIVPVVYQVLSDSPLLSGQPVNLPLPQQYAAGYANGTIQVDYNVVNPTSTRWSNLSSNYVSNTTF